MPKCLFGLFHDDRDIKFRNRNTTGLHVYTIKTHLADHRKEHMGKYEKPVSADDIGINFPDNKIPTVMDMLRKYEQARSGPFGEINVTEMRINLVSDARSF